MAGKTVYLVRHGDTAENAGGSTPELERGWKSYPLDAAGRKEALRIAAKLRKLDIRHIISSDLTRARQTAEIVGDALGIKPQFDSNLRTWNTGKCAGKLKSKVQPQIANLVRYYPDESCAGGESFHQFCDRVLVALESILKKNNQTLAIVIHANIERLIAAKEATNWKELDPDVFLAKPEQPGHIEKWTVNPSQLSGSQKSRKASSSGAANANTSRAVNVIIHISS